MYMSDERGESVLGDKGDTQDWRGEKGEGQEERGWSGENAQQTTETVMKNYTNEQGIGGDGLAAKGLGVQV